jgi:hypothetical protein
MTRTFPGSERRGNMPPLPGVFPDYAAPIVRNTADGRELTMARWGNAVAGVRTPGPQDGSGRHQYP